MQDKKKSIKKPKKWKMLENFKKSENTKVF